MAAKKRGNEKAPQPTTRIVNRVDKHRCRTRTCAPSAKTKAFLSAELGLGGRSKHKGFAYLFEVIGLMKESNVWGNRIKGYLFRGDIPAGIQTSLIAFATSGGWKVTLGERVTKYGIMVGSEDGKKHLLIIGKNRHRQGIYCSLTII